MLYPIPYNHVQQERHETNTESHGSVLFSTLIDWIIITFIFYRYFIISMNICHRICGRLGVRITESVVVAHPGVLRKRRSQLCTFTSRSIPDDDQSDDVASSSTPPSMGTPEGFVTLERVIRQRMDDGNGALWKEVEGCWVLYPPGVEGSDADSSGVKCVIHMVGGAFVGAAPQVAYRRLLEALAERGALIIATPYATGFDHLKTVDQVYFSYSRCIKSLGPRIQMVPSYGLGHSLGSLIHVLMCSRYVVPREGNILMSFNNKPATDSIPFLSPLIAPSARALGPLLSQLATSPLRAGVEQWLDVLKGAVPSDAFRQLVPVVEQLTPIYLDVANGTQEFTPPPEETRQIIRDGYAVRNNVLLKFSDDSIDETSVLASVLQTSPLWNQGSMELTVKSLPGDHARPLQQDLRSQLGMSDEIADFTSQRLSESESFWNSIGSLADQVTGLPPIAKEQLSGLAKTAKDVTALVAGGIDTDATADVDALASTIASYIDVLDSNGQVMLLPPSSDT
jgi:hypothetical protein